MKTLLIHIPKTAISDLGGFIFNIAVFGIIAFVGIVLIINLPKLVEYIEKIIMGLFPSMIIFWILLLGPILLIFFNINESHFAMWVGIILTACHLITYVVGPIIIPFIRKTYYKLRHNGRNGK